MRNILENLVAGARELLLSAALLAMPAAAHAQIAQIYGSLGNFDVVNNTGQDAHGFEIQIEGVTEADIFYSFGAQRYGAATVVPYAGGVFVRWMSPYDASAQQFVETTVPFARGGNFAGTCYMWNGPSYTNSGCEHFGVSLTNYFAKFTHRWLVADPQVPGALAPWGTPAAIPAPVYAVVPPARAGDPAALAAEIQPPEPAESPELYGDAQWVKIFKTQLDREVSLDELMSDNPTVPQDAAQVETAWDILQASPPSGGNQRRHRNQGNLNPTTRSVIRRYETYAYTGAYDPLTHQVVCGGDGTCSAPLAGELGDFLGAQMAAANVEVNALIVTSTGPGSVASSDKVVSCGSKCSGTYNLGTAVSLTANPGGAVFAGWNGACGGNQLTCDVTVNGQTNVRAVFLPQFTLSVGRSNSGTVIGTPNGNDRQLNCGGACSAKFTQGATVTLTATPPAGKSFINWTGSGAGACNLSTNPVCNVTITGSDLSVQANFSK